MKRLTHMADWKMFSTVAWILLLALLSLPLASEAQGQACADLETAKRSTYGFRPSKLNANQRKEKSDAMDGFWALVKTRGAAGTNCLRDMLLTEKADGYFVFDASSLLYSLDSSPASLAAISQGLALTNLDDVDILSYVQILVRLSQANVDIGPLADKYLSYPNVETYVPQHAMKLDRESGALILYGSMSPVSLDKYLALIGQE